MAGDWGIGPVPGLRSRSQTVVIALDTETKLFGPGQVAPDVICASFADGKTSFVLANGDSQMWPLIEQLLSAEEIVGHRIQYDLACIRATKPELTSKIFSALAANRVHDTLLREKLVNLGTHGDLETLHGKQLTYGLDALAWRRLGVNISDQKKGEDIWRLRFAELDGRRASDYPPEAYDYARQDAALTHEIHEDQQREHAALFKVEPFHVRSAFCLYLMTQRGLAINPVEKAALEAEIHAELAPEKTPDLYKPLGLMCEDCLSPVGIARRASPEWSGCETCKEAEQVALLTPACPGRPKRGGGLTKPQPEKVNKSKALQPLVKMVCEANEIPVRLTEKGQEELGSAVADGEVPLRFVATSAEVLEEISHLHPVLEQYAYRQDRIKLRDEVLPNLEWPRGSGTIADVVHANYDPLKKTGRAGSSGNRKGKPAAYPSFHVQAAHPRMRRCFRPREGFVFAQADFNAIDLCSLAQTIYDLFGHSTHRDQLLAGYELHALLGAVLAADDDPEFREQISGFREDDRKVYGAFLARDAKWVKRWRSYAKVFGLTCPGGGGLNTLVKIAAGYGFKIDKTEARAKRARWYQVYPEMHKYLHGWVEAQGGVYTSPLGMVRAGCSYTEMANGRALQTPAAEGMKEAMWRVTRACYDPELEDVLLGSFPVVNMHDELVLEVPEDGREAERAERLSELMVAGMRSILPDVPIRADPVLTRTWTKDAKPVRDSKGKLIVWEDK